MKSIYIFAAMLFIAPVGNSAFAAGCLKGAAVGGLAGHMAGHGVAGAAVGCAVGHHEANKAEPKTDTQAAQSETTEQK
jgi:uncharacterized protein YcfJ